MDIKDIKLYVILDIGILNSIKRDPLDILWKCFLGGARMFQLRGKHIAEGKLLETARILSDEAHKLGALFIVNDSVCVAKYSGADGVHLGEDDLPIEMAKKILGDNMIIGASAKSLETASNKYSEGADYIGYGAIFPTSTKPDAQPGNIETLFQITSSLPIPVFPLGGINDQNIHKLVASGVKRVCVASGIIASANPEMSARNIISALGN